MIRSTLVQLNKLPKRRQLCHAAIRSTHVGNSSQPTRPADQPIQIHTTQIVKKFVEPLCSCDNPHELSRCSKSERCQYRVNGTPVHIKTHGCQMNVNDTSIIASILEDYGYRITEDADLAEIYLLMTCAVREKPENKIWSQLQALKSRKGDKNDPLKQIGLLGCMAERLKEKALNQWNGSSVDIIAGPDSYRDLPRLFSINRLTKDKVVNCLLSFDETYSDIRPVTKLDDVSSFVSITRGCDNLCSFCVVPFTRGRERSRPFNSIVEDTRALFNRGIREVTLLGQNVNSYRDLSTDPMAIGRPDLVECTQTLEEPAEGFKTVYKARQKGLTFDVLLEEIAKISPELRIRFTSPHPKDFTDEVIDVVSRYPNVARCVHLPAQSGSNRILEKMRRGYTVEAYMNLVSKLRRSIPDISITSDFICGFCSETEEDHQRTLDLVNEAKYNFVYAFAYSKRTKTHAYHNFDDDVEYKTKTRRVSELYELFRRRAEELNQQRIGSEGLLLVEGPSSRSSEAWQGRISQNVRTIIPKAEIFSKIEGFKRPVKPGDYVVCRILESNSQSMKAEPLYIAYQGDYLYGDTGSKLEARDTLF